MNRTDLINDVAERMGGTRADAVSAVTHVIAAIHAAIVRGEKLAIPGFGIFEKVVKPARSARNPATGATVQVPERAAPRFRPAGKLRVDVRDTNAGE
jgi:DNA-binding protein HU-beta